MNTVELDGNVGRDLELQKTNGGTSVLTLSLATTFRYEKDGKKEERTQWHRVTVWGRAAEAMVAAGVGKGSRLYIRGQLEYREWQREGEDKPRRETDVRCSLWLPVDRGALKRGWGEATGQGGGERAPEPPPPGDDAIPF